MNTSQRNTKAASPRRRHRRGATLVETGAAMMIFLTLVLGMFDLGMAVMRQHMIADASRALARRAAVHGALADELGAWGPAGFTGVASGGDPICQAIAPRLTGMDLSEVELSVSWLDGGNDVRNDDRVRVTVRAPYRPMITFVFGSPTWTLSSESTVPIAH